MTRFYQSLKQNRRTKAGNAEPRNGASAADGSQVNSAQAIPLKRKTYGSTTPLFAADPEENVRLWMQKYFGDVRVEREDAIRHWLSRPPESRVSSFTDSPAKAQPAPQASVSVLESLADVPPNGKLEEPNPVNAARLPRFMPTTVENGSAGQSRSWAKFAFRTTMYLLVGVLLVTLVWAIPLKRRATTQASSETNAQSQTAAETGAASQAQDSASSAVTKFGATRADSNAVKQLSRIESISVGCEPAQPCIEVNTSGPQVKPEVITLAKPDRFVMDFDGVEYKSGVHQIAENRGVVKGVRVRGISEDNAKRTRVVIDLSTQSESVLRALQNKYVVEIHAKNSSN
jgi:hypothetical protein